MASLNVSAEQPSCPVCCEIFKAPVFLSCSHSVCKECLHQFWRTKKIQECPVCRRRSSKLEPPCNLALQKLCELYLKNRNEIRSTGSEEICSVHREKLKLFCLEDKQPVCVECVTSQQHVNHTFRPIIVSSKEEHYTSLKSLEEKLKHRESTKGKFEKTGQYIQNKNDLMKKSIFIKDGNPAQYRLQTRTDNLNQPYRKLIFGERDKNKPHKTILMVGETGTGKTTLINAMINYMLGVKREDKVWFEITHDQSDRTSVHSQTSIITVYEFYPQESPIHLTIIDTPGYGDTRGIDYDKEISMMLHSLSKSAEEIEIHAVCLVIKAAENRLSDRQIYIFDAVQSLFGRDIAENIVLLITHSSGTPPKNALTAVKEAEIKCAVNDQNRPVFFLFDNCQSDTVDEEYGEEYGEDHEQMLDQSWNRSFRGMAGFFKFLDNINPKSLKMTRDVLQQRKQLEAKISHLKSQVETMDLKQNELKQTQDGLEKNKEYVKNKKNFQYEVDVPYKERVDIDPAVAKEATCCTVCEENCHYPECWWVKDLSWCSVMKDDQCKVCTNKCHYSKHVKEAKIYVTKTKKENRTYEDLKKEYDDKIGDNVSVVKKLEEELQELEIEKVKVVIDAFYCVEKLETIALATDSLITLQHIDFIIEKLKEIKEPEKADILESIKKRAGEEKKEALGYIARYFLKHKNK